MSNFYQYDTRGASAASQIINLQHMVEKRDAEIERLRAAISFTQGLAESYLQRSVERGTEIERLRSRLSWFETAGGVAVTTKVHEQQAEIKRLRKALLFYAHPEKVKPGAIWNEGYPGGITYSEDSYTYLDNGDIAREALGDE